MSVETFLDGRVTLHGGDCLAVLRTLPDACVDSVVTDPPYHLTSIVKRFGGQNAAPAKSKQTGAFARSSRGFMGKVWDGGDIAFQVDLWAEVLRVLKPGGHLVAFSGTRTYHRMAVAIEDAGFDIRDQLAWTYGTGFPKSHDVSKAIDKAAGAEREVIGPKFSADGRSRGSEPSKGRSARNLHGGGINGHENDFETLPATDAARQWHGWGSALKPAWEPICLARKPLDGTIAENVLKHGVGGLNIDGCCIPAADAQLAEKYASVQGAGPRESSVYGRDVRGREGFAPRPGGRFPANIVHDGSPEVLSAFPITGRIDNREAKAQPRSRSETASVYGVDHRTEATATYSDIGSAARFFYTAKADADDRIGSRHPTVKPVDLMQWLVRLVTPKGGTVLDLFAGTGTTGEAAFREGCHAVRIEREEEYRADIARRMALAMAGPATRKAGASAAKARADDFAGTLFADGAS